MPTPVTSIAVNFGMRNSVLTYPALRNAYSRTFLYLEVRPSSANGLILLNTQLNGPDFIAIVMRSGRVEFWYDLGQGAIAITSTQTLTLNTWHSIQASRMGRVGELVVDGMPAVTGTSVGSFTMLQVSSDLYLGAAPTPTSLPIQLRWLNGFQGCVREFRTSTLTTSSVHLIEDALSGQGISVCPEIEACNSQSCMNGGNCTNTIDQPICQCAAGFMGTRCEMDQCEARAPCQNNGVCYAEAREGTTDILLCNCSAPFTGDSCAESKLSPIHTLTYHD